MYVNYSLPPFSKFSSVTTTSDASICRGIRVSIDKNKGKVSVRPKRSLLLQFEDLAEKVDWLELSLELSKSDWLSCRTIFLRYRAKSSKMMKVHPALRFSYKNGFYDHFADDAHQMDVASLEYTSSFSLSRGLLTDVKCISLHLFFESRDNLFELDDLVLSGIK
ncbi:hypothetical protein [Amphritea balenae]|uniref:hypothetical protein n=1 Tax=Amphritea balenae TaxID=452629 RepID=UPI0016640F15|nr:hypothetical protein [Amphritea balenae]GGK74835.1 hypothetical protein GCM10007941_26090 [Amphritea balenae]